MKPYQTPITQAKPVESNQAVSIWKKWKFRSREFLSWFWILAIFAYLTAGSVKSVINTYQLKKEITNLKQQVIDLTIEKERLQALSAYYDTDEYREKELRKRLLLKRPGEIVIAIPPSVVKKNQSDNPEDKSTDKDQVEPKRANLEKWLEYFLKR